MTERTKVKRGFKAPCIQCGQEGCVSVRLDDVQTFECTECSGEWKTEDVRNLVDQWERVLAWVEMAPALD